MKKSPFWNVSGDIFINYQKKGFIGKGRIQLLEYIKEYGSLNKAAQQMKMSYKSAWDTIHSMNSLSESPLVEFKTGGKGGGGANLTQEGKKWIQLYRTMEEKSRDFFENMNSELQNMIKTFFD